MLPQKRKIKMLKFPFQYAWNAWRFLCFSATPGKCSKDIGPLRRLCWQSTALLAVHCQNSEQLHLFWCSRTRKPKSPQLDGFH